METCRMKMSLVDTRVGNERTNNEHLQNSPSIRHPTSTSPISPLLRLLSCQRHPSPFRLRTRRCRSQLPQLTGYLLTKILLQSEHMSQLYALFQVRKPYLVPRSGMTLIRSRPVVRIICTNSRSSWRLYMLRMCIGISGMK